MVQGGVLGILIDKKEAVMLVSRIMFGVLIAISFVTYKSHGELNNWPADQISIPSSEYAGFEVLKVGYPGRLSDVVLRPGRKVQCEGRLRIFGEPQNASSHVDTQPVFSLNNAHLKTVEVSRWGPSAGYASYARVKVNGAYVSIDDRIAAFRVNQSLRLECEGTIRTI